MRFVLTQSNCVVSALDLKDISIVLKKSLILKITFFQGSMNAVSGRGNNQRMNNIV